MDEVPRKVETNPLPEYPADALDDGAEGRVRLRVRIGADGSVESVRIEESSGTASLDRSALATVKSQWRFLPGRRDGIGVPCEVIVPIRFFFPDR